jgi:hypothetical protein
MVRKKSRYTGSMAVLWLLLIAGAVGGVYAYLSTETEKLSNEFVPAKVTCAVVETFQDGEKSDVKVQNTGNIDAYIRGTVVATFVSEDGKVLAAAPKEGVDYTVTWGAAGWIKGADGYWYHAEAVAPGETTAPLIDHASGVAAPAGYRLHIQILAAAFQAAPDTAVQEAWNVTVVNGEIVPN